MFSQALKQGCNIRNPGKIQSLLKSSVVLPKSLPWDALWHELPSPHTGIESKCVQKG